MQTRIMTLIDGRWRVSWEEDEEFSEWIAQQCAYILRMRNPYQYPDTDEHFEESWEFRSRLIGSHKYPGLPIEQHEYFMTIECWIQKWNHKIRGNITHQFIYGHEWEDLMDLMTMNGFSLNSISAWNHNSKTDNNNNMVIEPKLEITFVQRNLNREVIE